MRCLVAPPTRRVPSTLLEENYAQPHVQQAIFRNAAALRKLWRSPKFAQFPNLERGVLFCTGWGVNWDWGRVGEAGGGVWEHLRIPRGKQGCEALHPVPWQHGLP